MYYIGKDISVWVHIIGLYPDLASAEAEVLRLTAANTIDAVSYEIWTEADLIEALDKYNYIRFEMPGLNTVGMHPEDADQLWREWYEDNRR